MPNPSTPEPTDAELAILQVLWQNGTCTVRQVHEALRATQDTGYTTKLKLMQIMTAKGLLRRNKAGRSHVYEAAVTRNRTQRNLVSKILDRAFEGSASGLVMQLLQTKKVSAEEMTKLHKLLEEHSQEH